MVPSFPKFASVWSLVQARAALDGRIQAQAQQLALYGKRLTQRPVFGGDLRKLSESYSHLVTPQELLRLHTPFGTLCKLLSAQHEAAALAHVAERGSFETRRFFPGERHGSLLTVASRWCPQCVADDQLRFGFPFWRVHHHLPGLRHCWTHDTSLVQSCIGDGCLSTPKARFGLLPGIPCVCSQPEELSPDTSFGYRAYAALLRRLTVEPGIRLDPGRRLKLSDVSASGALSAGRHLLERWNCQNADALSHRLECKVSETQLLRLSKGQELGCHPALIVAMSALHQADDAAATESLQVQMDPPLTARDRAAIQSTAARVGFPVSAAMLLLDGESIASLEQRHGICSKKRARSFIALLPPHISSRIASPLKKPTQARIFSSSDSASVQHRARAEAHLAEGASTRTELHKRAQSTYKWLRQNDPLWLQQHLPLPGSVKLDSAHEVERFRRRATALAMKQQGFASRDELNKQARSPYRWLMKNDSAWLDEHFPKIDRRRP